MYRETLPESCPPAHAKPFVGRLIRLVGPDALSAKDFDSRTKLGSVPFPGKECGCASCSMFLESISKDALLDMMKFPNLKKKTVVALVNVDANSGLTETRGQHVDLWMFAQYDPLLNIADTIEIENYGN